MVSFLPEEALQYTEKSTLPLNKKEVAREILQTRNYYAEERKRLLQIFPELEPFVKTIQHVERKHFHFNGNNNKIIYLSC